MAKRRKMPKGKDRKKFSRGAMKENAKNHYVPRGGFRL